MAEDTRRDPWLCVRCGGPLTGCLVGLEGDSEWECLDCGLRGRESAIPRLNAGRRRHPGPRFVVERSLRDGNIGCADIISHADESWS